MRPSTRLPAWTISVGTHAALAVAIVLGVGRHRIDPPPPLQRLVWVEPEAPRAGRADGGAVAVPDSAVPPPTGAEPPHVPPPEAAPHPPVATKPPVPPKHPRLSSAASARAPAPVASAPAAAPGNPLGTGGAASNGTVGGLGDAPLALRDVATPPELVDRVLPEYPARARTLRIEGQVVLEVVLDRSGQVELDSIHVTHSIPILDAAAVAAVRQWHFRPARNGNDAPVRVRMEIPVRFVLR